MENVLGFSGPRNVDLDFSRPDGGHAGWTVIAGRNGAGKTSLLRCLAVMLAGRVTVASALAPAFPGWFAPGAEPGLLEATFALSAEDEASLAESGRLSAEPLRHVTWTLGPVERGPRNRHSFTLKSTLGYETTVSADSAPRAGGDIELGATAHWFAAGYGPFRRLSQEISAPVVGPASARQQDALSGTLDRFTTLFHEDEALSEGVAWLTGLHLQSLEGRATATRLLRTVLELLGDGLLPDDHAVVRVDSAGLWVRRAGREFPLRELSDGYKVVASLVLDIVRHLHLYHGSLKVRRTKQGIAFHTPGVVLIDEIDAHLHISWQQRIGEWLKRHFPKIQFIVTTHSPYICQSADPGGLIRLPGPGEDSAPRVVDEDTHRRIVHGSGDDAALSELFGLDTPYSREAEKARRDLVGLEEKVFAGTATKSELNRYQELSELLNSSLEARVAEVSGRLGRPPR